MVNLSLFCYFSTFRSTHFAYRFLDFKLPQNKHLVDPRNWRMFSVTIFLLDLLVPQRTIFFKSEANKIVTGSYGEYRECELAFENYRHRICSCDPSSILMKEHFILDLLSTFLLNRFAKSVQWRRILISIYIFSFL